MRNPGDVAVSYYYFTKMIKPVNYNGEFEDFFDLFLQGKGLNLIYVLLLIYEPKTRKWCGVEFQKFFDSVLTNSLSLENTNLPIKTMGMKIILG